MRSFTPHHRGGSGPPLVLLHGFTDSWRTWELVLERLERDYEVFAPTLPGHAGGPPLEEVSHAGLVAGVERLLDDAGVETAHLAGNSLGGYLALALAARGRARSVVALAPAGGWDGGPDPARAEHFERMQVLLARAAPYADAIVSSVDGRRRATAFTTVKFRHIPAELLAHQIAAAAACPAASALIEYSRHHVWELDTGRIEVPVRIAWGTEDLVLRWPESAARYRELLPSAEWIELENVGHCPQLDVPLETVELIRGFP